MQKERERESNIVLLHPVVAIFSYSSASSNRSLNEALPYYLFSDNANTTREE